MSKKPIIICGFPGVGKSCVANNRINILDAESSAFHWRYDPEHPENGRERNPDFPGNYIAYIKENMERYELDVILVATHKAVRDALKAEGIKYIVVAPFNDMLCLNEYMKRYVQRGNDIDFMVSLCKNWDAWLAELALESDLEGIPMIRLSDKEYLSDVLGVLAR